MGSNGDNVNLSVNGSIKTRQILVTNTGWADFVFDKNYNLRTLNQVKTYIEQNNHLPDVITTKEVETNGISIGDMQKTQMQKIEELTLYLIKLDEKVSKLEVENNNLRNKINF